MEMLTGGDFFSFLPKRKFIINEDLARNIAHQMATAIYYLHSFGIAHRDLKPENILMVDKSDSAEIKLVDLGLSRTFDSQKASSTVIYDVGSMFTPEILPHTTVDEEP